MFAPLYETIHENCVRYRALPFALNRLRHVMNTRQFPKLAAEAADLLLSYPWKFWFWGDSIGFEGLLDAGELTRQEKYLAFVYGAFKAWLARDRVPSEFEYTAPGVALLRVYEKTGDPALLDAARKHAEFMAGFRQTDSGAYVRYENAAIELPPELPTDHPDSKAMKAKSVPVSDGGPCVFVDSMHFDGPFFAKLHQTTGEEQYRRLALANICSQIDLLYDPQEELLHHFWMERTKARNGVLWGRGNGWGLLGLVETLEYLPADDPEGQALGNVLRKILARMARLQDPQGGWHTVLNDPTSYIEPSIAAFMVHVLSRSIEHGWVDADSFYPVLESAMSSMLASVLPGGLLDGVSYETFPSTRAEHYRHMPRGAMVPWGQGPLLAALWAYTRLQQSREPSSTMSRQAGG
jgi:unsaturated rhamnogalacturonyl hydrolase